MRPNTDSYCLLLLCSRLSQSAASDSTPLSAREWSRLEGLLLAASMTPLMLLGLSVKKIESSLGMHNRAALRIARLLDRYAQISKELNRLDNLGIWVVTKLESAYPAKLKGRLRGNAPTILFGSGEVSLLNTRGVAVVGSRNANPSCISLSESIGARCAESKLTVYSGGARGVDTAAMTSALRSGGTSAGLLAESLEQAVVATNTRLSIRNGQLVLATPFSSRAAFNAGLAMTRNKLIYALADYAIVVASEAGRGGTWAGAEEALKSGWIPVFVAGGHGVSEAHRLLIGRGALPLPVDVVDSVSSLSTWLEEKSGPGRNNAVQGCLF
jgi:DNA processing protein